MASAPGYAHACGTGHGVEAASLDNGFALILASGTPTSTAHSEAAARPGSEEIVARKANCGIVLLRRVLLLLQVSPSVRTGVWGEVGAWGGRSELWNSCNASNEVRLGRRAVHRRAHVPNRI
jgi:hypothetical protein